MSTETIEANGQEVYPTVGSIGDLVEVTIGELIETPHDGFVLSRHTDVTIEFSSGRSASFAGLPAGQPHWFSISRVLKVYNSATVYLIPRT